MMSLSLSTSSTPAVLRATSVEDIIALNLLATDSYSLSVFINFSNVPPHRF